MMTQQARILYPERFAQAASFRPYASDSAEAKARLIILALLVDGDIDEYELMALNRPQTLETLGITRQGFVRVLHELCEDLARLPNDGSALSIPRPLLSSLFNAISEPETQKQLLGMISTMIQSNGHISREELQYWKSAAQAWRQEAGHA